LSLLAVAVGGRGLVPVDEPVLLADDEALLRGRAAFETARVYGGRPFRLADHLARMRASSERLAIRFPDRFEDLAAQARTGRFRSRWSARCRMTSRNGGRAASR
jgi:4-amino-4-deoxychorismate lyase